MEDPYFVRVGYRDIPAFIHTHAYSGVREREKEMNIEGESYASSSSPICSVLI